MIISEVLYVITNINAMERGAHNRLAQRRITRHIRYTSPGLFAPFHFAHNRLAQKANNETYSLHFVSLIPFVTKLHIEKDSA